MNAEPFKMLFSVKMWSCQYHVSFLQGRFSINLSGTGLKLSEGISWISQGNYAVISIHKSQVTLYTHLYSKPFRKPLWPGPKGCCVYIQGGQKEKSLILSLIVCSDIPACYFLCQSFHCQSPTLAPVQVHFVLLAVFSCENTEKGSFVALSGILIPHPTPEL